MYGGEAAMRNTPPHAGNFDVNKRCGLETMKRLKVGGHDLDKQTGPRSGGLDKELMLKIQKVNAFKS